MTTKYINYYILPNQLYIMNHVNKILKKYKGNKINIILWEHPHFFGTTKTNNYKFNKKKLMLHRASMRYYFEKFLNPKLSYEYDMSYIEFNEKHLMKKDKNILNVAYDPVDVIHNFNNNIDDMFESPNFFLTKSDLQEYRQFKEPTKGFRFTVGFYVFGKKKINHLVDVKSTDKLNRKPISKSNISKNIHVSVINKRTKDTYVNEAAIYVNKHFPDNYGITDDFNYPYNHDTSNRWLREFIKYKFEKFGSYQDAMIKDNYALFHSVLSSSLNIGLLNPCDVLKAIKKVKTRIPINSYEGYVRQLFWREYQRYCYIHAPFIREKTHFDLENNLSKKWYDGTLNVEPVDNCVKRAFDTGYLHHIERLMIIGNYMMLNNINPEDGYKWFMEFSIDSYNWVMYQNVYDMVFCNSGGKTTTKPYITKSNYILQMSNYEKGEWTKEWDNKYDLFLENNCKKLLKFKFHFKLPCK